MRNLFDFYILVVAFSLIAEVMSQDQCGQFCDPSGNKDQQGCKIKDFDFFSSIESILGFDKYYRLKSSETTPKFHGWVDVKD